MAAIDTLGGLAGSLPPGPIRQPEPEAIPDRAEKIPVESSLVPPDGAAGLRCPAEDLPIRAWRYLG